MHKTNRFIKRGLKLTFLVTVAERSVSQSSVGQSHPTSGQRAIACDTSYVPTLCVLNWATGLRCRLQGDRGVRKKHTSFYYLPLVTRLWN